MSALDRLIPAPRLLEIDDVEIAAPPERVWEAARHGDLARTPLIRALFALREVPSRLAGRPPEPRTIKVDELVSTRERPGFQVLVDEPPHEVAVGAIGKVWEGEIPFVHVDDAAGFAAFEEPDYVKVAWALRVEPLGHDGSRLSIEVRVDATDAEAWSKFRRYFRFIGPASRFIRRSALSSIASELGREPRRRPLPGDALIADASDAIDHEVTIHAPPSAIWPWLVQMGCRRAGWYSIDLLDNGGARSAREIHPDLQELRVGDVIPATPEGDAGFEVLVVEPERALVLGGLWDPDAKRNLPFASPRPERFWQATWAFVLERLDDDRTRLSVRVRGAYGHEGFHATWVHPVHALMETAQLRHLKARAEGTLRRDDARDVLEGISGAARMALALATPFLRRARSHWGVDDALAARVYPGDDLVPEPRWSWTHGVEIDASAEDVWPWIAQIGADRGGFYSYQWLENLVGCDVSNAEVIHPEWEVKRGDGLSLHPKAPPLDVVALERGRWFVAHAPPDAAARAAGKPWATTSWLFHLEPLGPSRCRLVSRNRAACSDDLATRLAFGPALVEPVGFAMDRRMLLGIKERAESSACRKA